MMAVMRVIRAEPPPAIGISPPGVIIPPVVRIRIRIVFRPEIDLFACDQRIPVVHLA